MKKLLPDSRRKHRTGLVDGSVVPATLARAAVGARGGPAPELALRAFTQPHKNAATVVH